MRHLDYFFINIVKRVNLRLRTQVQLRRGIVESGDDGASCRKPEACPRAKRRDKPKPTATPKTSLNPQLPTVKCNGWLGMIFIENQIPFMGSPLRPFRFPIDKSQTFV